jgi:hypothetical protein
LTTPDHVTQAQSLAILLGEIAELISTDAGDTLTELTIIDPEMAESGRYTVRLGRAALQAVIDGVDVVYKNTSEAIGAHPEDGDDDEEERDAMSSSYDRDYAEAAQQHQESAEEALALEQAYERYPGTLSWSRWLAEGRPTY